MSTKLRWGILGTGNIARKLAVAVQESTTGVLAAVGSRTQAKADAFGKDFEIPRCHPTYDALLADPEVDVVYISLPNHMHAEWAIKCAQAGKHMLCEKPLCVNHAQAMAVIEAVQHHGVFMLEAFMYRCHPQTAMLVELVKSGVVGEVRVIQASFSYNMGQNLDNIRLQNSAAGGGVMDVGCYTMSAARLIAGAALGLDVAEPLEIKGVAHIGKLSRVDEYATAAVKFPGNILATLACGSQVGMENMVKVWGSKGSITVPNPWFPNKGENTIQLKVNGNDPQNVIVQCDLPLYAHEVDTVAKHLANKQAPSPCMTWEDSLGQQKALDMWRASIGLNFDEESSEKALSRTITGQTLAHRKPSSMTYSAVAGIAQPVSRLVMGTMIYGPQQQSFCNTMMDYFFQIGGNCIDTAFVYGGGNGEKAIGNWMRQRNIRDQIVLIGKGGCTIDVTPEIIDRELAITLDRLQTPYVDIYFMHRDNLKVPVGEFVDCLNRHRAAGRIRAFGGSNWSPDRLQATLDYARRSGTTGFAASSPNFSLARWNEPVWSDCVSASDPASRAWYALRQFPLFSWSSQAMGFFTGRFSPDDKSNGDMVRCWYNADNWTRYERACELAKKKGVAATQIAAAYVLSQAFPTHALIGPRTLEETRTTALGLELQLSADEVKWLNLEV